MDMIKDRIIEVYKKIMDEYHVNHSVLSKPEAVIKISPDSFIKLVEEDCGMIVRDSYTRYLVVCGMMLPLIVANDIPEDVMCIIQTREDYERLERMELEEKFIRMWGKKNEC